jgi:dipeptidyl aminopeptidase/acylaminoacyl peptidase
MERLTFDKFKSGSVANWRSPVLLVDGDDDRNVPFQQTTDVVEKLRNQKVVFEELIFPDELHDLLRWSDWIRAYRATAEFFDRRLAGTGKKLTQ